MKNLMEKGCAGSARMAATTGMLFAAAIVLAAVESVLPSLPLPGVRFGLSNIVVMYALFFLGRGRALMIAVLKAFFVVCTRGGMAGILSLCGGLASVAVMTVLGQAGRGQLSYLIISIAGAIAHNMGQYAAVSVFYTGFAFAAYVPLLTIAGIAAGAVTSILLRYAMPALQGLAVMNKQEDSP